MQALYAYYKRTGFTSINEVEKELNHSISKTYELYHLLFLLIIEINSYAQNRLEIAQNKKLPSNEDLHPNTKFINNKIIHQISINNELLRFLDQKKLSWVKYPEIIKGLYQVISKSNEYANYMDSTESDYTTDKGFVVKVYKNIISNYEPLYQALEEQSIFWNDEIEFVISAIIKTIKKFNFEESENTSLMPLFKSDDDKDFSKTLFRKVILNENEYSKLIEDYSKNWDIERIAFIDTVLIEMAIAEAIEFKSIPVKVTFNEYIELSKFYSTKRSNVFINGILDKIFDHLKSTNQIIKHGRGLIDN